MVKVTAYRLFH